MFRPPEGATHYRAFVSGFSDKMKVSIVWYKDEGGKYPPYFVWSDEDGWDSFVPAEGVKKHSKKLIKIPKI